MTGILYFSATGNSLYIAERIKEKTGGKLVYIPRYLGNGGEFDRLILVTPVYSYGMPRHVYDLLPRLDKSKELVIIQNYGGMIGGADWLTYRYALKNGLNVRGMYAMKMPENFTLTFTVPKFYVRRVLKGAEKRIDKIAAAIESGERRLPKKKKTKEAVYLKNKSNWRLIGKRFSVTEACVKCGKCAEICPAGNISMTENGPVFGETCAACLGCYHRCPQKAIVYLKKKKKDRYVNPNVEESRIGYSEE